MSEAPAQPSPADVVAFWRAAGPKRWFEKDAAFDDGIRRRFLKLHEAAAAGKLTNWEGNAEGALALLILLDQFPRNMFRSTARAFVTDMKARELSRHAIASGFDRELSPIMRMFLYLPLEHSENLNDQLESVRLTGALAAENPGHTEILEHAEQHLEVIRRFGRFPGRNHALGWQSTEEEMDFLKDQKRK